MTSVEKNSTFKTNSPRKKACDFVKNTLNVDTHPPVFYPPELKKARKSSIKKRNSVFRTFGGVALPTLSKSIKCREIIKNNYGMPKIPGKKFMPVNRVEAKQ